MPKAKVMLISFVFFIIVSFAARANNIQVSSGALSNVDTTAKTAVVNFDISWENSWRHNINYDSAWVFVKYSTDSGVTWNHATLKASGTNPSGFSTGTGTSVDIIVPSDLTGCFIQRATAGSGSLDTQGAGLVWDYAADGVSDGASVEIKVFAVEMVYIPQGSFYIGDGNGASQSLGSFYQSANTAVEIDATLKGTIKCGDTSYDDSVLETTGIGIDGDGGLDTDNNGTIDNADFPTGYNAFYMMKYELSEGQWVDFFNILTSAQKTQRDITDSTGKNSDGVVYRNTVAWTTGDATTTRPDRACTYLSWADVIAYADWAALRPMTELEFEKAARGSGQPVLYGYAWGTDTIVADSSLTISGTEDGTETITTDLSLGACLYGNNAHTGGDGGTGPLRCGIFATGASTKVTAGASYYGVMELSGNVYERPVTVGHADGRNFTGTHGDGDLSTPNSDWPGDDAVGGGLRGGFWYGDESVARVSYRGSAAYPLTGRYYSYGGRCVRASP